MTDDKRRDDPLSSQPAWPPPPAGDAADANRIDELLSLFERRRAEGRPLSDEELGGLCRQHPEDLAEVRHQVALLQAADHFLDLPDTGESQGKTLIAGPAASPAGLNDLPSCVGRYAVGRELKQGGMGRIVQVWDEDFKRPLALKLVRGRYAKLEQRLIYEGRLTGSLQHPGIPPVHDQGWLPDGRPYFIMKLIQGASLSDLLGKRAFPAEELPRFLLILEQLCEAVGYAHSRRVIHRDLKPANVMVGAFGEVQVIDWGLAKVVGPAPQETAPADDGPGMLEGLQQVAGCGTETTANTVLGTPAYMAPEQARGELDGLDARADVFGLGAILCEVLTGGPPYRGRDVYEVHARARRADLAEAWARLEGCGADGDLVTLARGCLAVERQGRPADGAAVARAVAAYRQEVQRRLKAAEVEAAAAAARAAEEKKRRLVERQRRRVALALAAAVVLLVLGGCAWGVWYQGERVREEEHGQYLNREVGAALAEAEEQFAELDRQLGNPLRVHELLSDLGRWQERLQAVSAALRRASALGGGDAGAADRLGQLEKRLEREQQAWALADRLDRVRLLASASVDGKFDFQVAVREYPRVFAGTKLDVTRGETKEVAARIMASPARYAVVAALDDWANFTPEQQLRERLLEIARQADPNPWRDRFRDPKVWEDVAALQRLAAEVQVREHSPQVLLSLTFRLLEKGKYTLEVLRKAVRHHPRDFWLLFNLGNFALEPGEKAGWIQAALAIRPRSGPAHYNLGRALKAQKDLEGAAAHYRKSIEYEPNYAPAYHNLGAILIGRKELEEAIILLDKAIQLDPNIPETHYNLGNALRDRGDLEKAVTHYRKAIELKPDYSEAHNNLGIALATRDRGKAIVQYREALKHNPNNALAHHNLGNALRDNKESGKAIGHYFKALDLGLERAEVHIGLGNALADTGNVDEAMAHYHKAIKLNPSNAVVYLNLGNVLLGIREVDGAIAQFQMAAQSKPDFALAYNNLGFALLAKGDIKGALANYNKARAVNPKLAIAYINLAALLFQQSKFAESLEVERQLLQVLPAGAALRKAAANRIQVCEKFLAMERTLDAYLDKGEVPARPHVAFLAGLCGRPSKGYYATAARLYAVLFGAVPNSAETRPMRFRAASCALLAVAGQGREPDQLTATGKKRLRALALMWLRTDLQRWAAQFQARDPKALPGLLIDLPAWKKDPALAVVRDVGERAELPADEQKDWEKLWADVDRLLKLVGRAVRTQRFPGTLTWEKREQAHEVKLQTDRVYVIDLESTQFDAHLRLQDNQGKLVAKNDDIDYPNNLNSRLVFTATKDGSYRLVATSFQQRGTGAYTLTVRSFVEARK